MSFLERFSIQRTGTAATADVAAAAALPASAAPVTATPGTVFVELGAASQQANVSRNGVAVPVVDVNPDALKAALGGTTPVVAKVVSQSIPTGVSVAKGASVDLVLAEPSSINVSVLQNAYEPLATQSLDAVYKSIVRDNPAVQSVLARNSSSTGLSTADQATLTTALDNANASLGTGAGQTIDAAFSTLQAAFTFGT
jgi:hypothetical protein